MMNEALGTNHQVSTLTSTNIADMMIVITMVVGYDFSGGKGGIRDEMY